MQTKARRASYSITDLYADMKACCMHAGSSTRLAQKPTSTKERQYGCLLVPIRSLCIQSRLLEDQCPFRHWQGWAGKPRGGRIWHARVVVSLLPSLDEDKLSLWHVRSSLQCFPRQHPPATCRILVPVEAQCGRFSPGTSAGWVQMARREMDEELACQR